MWKPLYYLTAPCCNYLIWQQPFHHYHVTDTSLFRRDSSQSRSWSIFQHFPSVLCKCFIARRQYFCPWHFLAVFFPCIQTIRVDNVLYDNQRCFLKEVTCVIEERQESSKDNGGVFLLVSYIVLPWHVANIFSTFDKRISNVTKGKRMRWEENQFLIFFLITAFLSSW